MLLLLLYNKQRVKKVLLRINLITLMGWDLARPTVHPDYRKIAKTSKPFWVLSIILSEKWV
jgi:hypothetical protein